MLEIIGQPNWNFIITVGGILLGVIGILVSINLNLGKDLILYPDYENLTVDKDDPIQTHKLTLSFQNIDKNPLTKSDFLRGHLAEFEGLGSLDSVLIESTCEYNSVKLVPNGEKLIVENDFLEAKKIIRLIFTFKSTNKDFMVKVRSKIIGGEAIKEDVDFGMVYQHHWMVGHKKTEAYFTNFLLYILSIGALTWQIAKHAFNIDYGHLLKFILKWNKDSFFLLFIIMIVSGIVILSCLKLVTLSVPYASKAKKEKTFFQKSLKIEF